MDKHSEDPPFEGGSQPVEEHPTPVPHEGRSAMQIFVIAVGVLALLGALLWILVPILSA